MKESEMNKFFFAVFPMMALMIFAACDVISSLDSVGVGVGDSAGPRPLVMVGGSLNNPFLATSMNGQVWTEQDMTTITSKFFKSGIYQSMGSGGLFVAVGLDGIIVTSPDAENWTKQTVPKFSLLNDITYADDLGLFITVGSQGTVLTSQNGTTWEEQSSQTSDDLYGVIYGTSVVAVGNNSSIVTSLNGTDWTMRSTGFTENLRDVTYDADNGRYVAVGIGSFIVQSDNGIDWTVVSTSGIDATDNLFTILYIDGAYHTGGLLGKIYLSNTLTGGWIVRATNFGDVHNISKARGGIYAAGSTNKLSVKNDTGTWSPVDLSASGITEGSLYKVF